MDRLLALVWLRTRMWWHGLRSGSGAMDAVAAMFVSVLGAVMSIGLAIGLGAVTHLALSGGDPQAQRVGLLIVFWVLGFLATFLPLVFGMGQPAVPLNRLSVFPLSRGTLYRISLAASFAGGAHLLWYPSLFAVAAVVLIGHGAGLIPVVSLLVALVGCLAVWCHTLLLMLQRVMQRRSLRELAVLLGLIVLMTVSVVPALFESQGVELESTRFLLPEALTPTVGKIASVFPPTIAAGGLGAVLEAKAAEVLPALGWLGLWITAGVAIGYRVFVRSLTEGGGVARPTASAGRTSNRTRTSVDLLTFDRVKSIPPQVRAVAAKDLTYLLRSTLGKFNIVMMPLFVVIVGLVLGRDFEGPVLGIDATALLFLGAMLYVSMFSNNVIYNAFAWEGAGVRSHFISPVPLEHVILGKNLGVWIYNGILGLECLVTFGLVVGLPTPATGLSGLLVFAAALLGSTVAGNFISAAFPVARDPSKFNSSPSQTGMAVAFGMLVVTALLVGGLVAIPALLGASWLQPLLLAALVAVEVVIYRVMLRPVACLMADRRERLVEALQIAT